MRTWTLLEQADFLTDRVPGLRVEMIGGILTVSPVRDLGHARVLTDLTVAFLHAGLGDGEAVVVQGVGLWLPTGSEDYAIPDLSVVSAGIEDHLVEFNCYDPVAFRLVLEVTSANYNNDLNLKAVAYAQARVPVYVVVNRGDQQLHVLSDPVEGEYTNHRIHAAGELAPLPVSLGAEVTLDVAELLEAGRPPKPEA
ncbi:Uma2 family endonuclease [Streptomyces sp. NPDC046557]|uniref:Uma2 family endonuclease n=1 Tax=Streptomyces sp. NPDC046557 TaxID=3155372 RepID=UPI0033C8551D